MRVEMVAGSDKDQASAQQCLFSIHSQYVKDFSFENPNFLEVCRSESGIQPSISVNVETKANVLQDGFFMIDMLINAESKLNGKKAFIVDLSYSAVVSVSQDLDSEAMEIVLLVQVPFLMFPFARDIVHDAVRNGGYPPLLIEPVDFYALYLQKKELGGNSPIVN